MSGGVYHSPEGHGVRDLAMEPNVFVRREEPCEAGANDTDDIAQHGHQNHATVESKDKTCTTRSPYGPFETVQGSELVVRFLK